jgi:hypothetical protein
MEEFAISLKEFNRFENLELYLNNNLLTKFPVFTFNNSKNRNVIKKMKLHFGWNNKFEKMEEFIFYLKDLNRLEDLELYINNN